MDWSSRLKRPKREQISVNLIVVIDDGTSSLSCKVVPLIEIRRWSSASISEAVFSDGSFKRDTGRSVDKPTVAFSASVIYHEVNGMGSNHGCF